MLGTNDINYQTVHLTHFIMDSAQSVFNKTIKKQSIVNYKPKWLNENCKVAKYEYKLAKSRLKMNCNDVNRLAFCKLRNKYNNTRKAAKRKFMISESRRLHSMAKTNPKQFWKNITASINNQNLMKII